jgi:hypothetical protein
MNALSPGARTLITIVFGWLPHPASKIGLRSGPLDFYQQFSGWSGTRAACESVLALKNWAPTRLLSYFFRKRLAFATARARHGDIREANDALSAPNTKRDADRAAASAFSLTIRRYSAGEQSFRSISRVRRAIVSHDANISSVIIAADDLLRRLRTFIKLISGWGYMFACSQAHRVSRLLKRRHRAKGGLKRADLH